MKEKPLAGCVFRVEVVSENVAYPVREMKAEIEKLLKSSPNIKETLIEELYEDIKLFKGKEEEKTIITVKE